MRVVATTNDPVRLSFLMALLADAGIPAILLDHHASVMEGSVAAIQRRLAVATADESRARRVLAEAGELSNLLLIPWPMSPVPMSPGRMSPGPIRSAVLCSMR